MKKTKALLSALALASATTFMPQVASAAHGTSTDLVLENDQAFFGAIFDANNAGTTFSNRYNFTTNMAGWLTADVISISGNNGVNLTGFSLFDNEGSLIGGTRTMNGEVDAYSISNYNLAAGSYWLEVSGEVVGSGMTKYYGSLALAPVPEPETYAMMLGGLGLLAVAARRRKQKDEKAAA